ncbi:FAD-binding monooxygenase [Streptomyces sp. NP160]|uniref:FAD-dependent monooxygenase n=1 Tax=Streptomyces sp. NP160 TaxID=2586637 RepID=UPI0011180B9A|nr:FAD-dependent monooxygenase [Streptomyces sp. NP160]TNM69631.1 FAD-binding monooxygenase [Streptomyces sp. NP160]
MTTARASKVLISGASIAGPALVHWLARAGVDVTVVERAPELREGGHNIDVRGAGREVLRRMGLEEDVLAHTTGEEGTRFLDERGRVLGEFPASTSQTGGPTAEVEVLRGRLSRLLVDSCEGLPGRVQWRFGDQVAEVHDRLGGDDDASGVDVVLASGVRERFDVVVVAEGLRSRTRQQVFGGDRSAHVKELGAYCAYLTVPREPTDDRYWTWQVLGRGRSAHLRPDDEGTTRGLLTFLSDVPGLDELEPRAAALVVQRLYAGTGPIGERLTAALDTEPFYFEALGQAVLPRWSKGRVVLAGDAAHCASPVSGMSTTLALVGAYVLAGELTRPGAPVPQALEAYERTLRPLVDAAQKLPPGTPRIGNPRHTAEIRVLGALVSAASSRPVQRLRLGERLISPPADAVDLPEHAHLR